MYLLSCMLWDTIDLGAAEVGSRLLVFMTGNGRNGVSELGALGQAREVHFCTVFEGIFWEAQPVQYVM